MPKNPIEGLEKPKLKRRLPEFPDEEEARELLKTCIDTKLYYKTAKIRNIAIVALFLFTGVRRKELLNLVHRNIFTPSWMNLRLRCLLKQLKMPRRMRKTWSKPRVIKSALSVQPKWAYSRLPL